ncbi:MAG: CDP-alcohol phosphatidyltransferase family protein, partial [Planctomycetes bacterium]|nr:CDP-alcohol phosphatidyltransferase family protein [Planctomycetota bacterium]
MLLKISWPNRLTIARILLIGPFVVALLNLQEPAWATIARRVAVCVFLVMAVTDGLDGYLARRLRQETVAGKFLDPLADKLLILFSVVLLAHEGTHVPGARLPATVAVIAVGKDLIVVLGFCIIYFSTSKIFIRPNG